MEPVSCPSVYGLLVCSSWVPLTDFFISPPPLIFGGGVYIRFNCLSCCSDRHLLQHASQTCHILLHVSQTLVAADSAFKASAHKDLIGLFRNFFNFCFCHSSLRDTAVRWGPFIDEQSLNIFILQGGQHCTVPVSRLIYIKTMKTGSSTLTNILYR